MRNVIFSPFQYADPSDANTAVTILNGVPLCGRAMKIQSVDGMVNMQNMELIMKMNDKMASKFASDNKGYDWKFAVMCSYSL